MVMHANYSNILCMTYDAGSEGLQTEESGKQHAVLQLHQYSKETQANCQLLTVHKTCRNYVTTDNLQLQSNTTTDIYNHSAFLKIIYFAVVTDLQWIVGWQKNKAMNNDRLCNQTLQQELDTAKQ